MTDVIAQAAAVTAEAAQVEQTAQADVAVVETKAEGIVSEIEAEYHVVINALVARIHALEAHFGFVKTPIPTVAAPAAK